MVRTLSATIAIAAVGCGESTKAPGAPDAAGGADASAVAHCTAGDETKIKFTQANACGNDGGVEFCIPDHDAGLRSVLAAIAPQITCAAGGGRAGCSASPGLLLCSYPTAFPADCASQHGAMTAKAWADMCALSGVPQITQIVPTILE